jgi:NADH dehydrogenase FAD-containing subunit
MKLNNKADVLIIGGSAAGVTAALTTRRYNKNAHITVIKREEETLIPCGIPYIFGTIMDIKKDLISNQVLSNNNIELIIDEVTSLNRGRKTVSLSRGCEVGYKKLVLGVGSVPASPPIPGKDLGNVFSSKRT